MELLRRLIALARRAGALRIGCGGLSAVHREYLCHRPRLDAQGDGGGLPMSIENRRQLENTRRKLQELEQLYTKTRQGPAANEHVRELTLCSLRKRINQFKEEITRFKARVRSAAADD